MIALVLIAALLFVNECSSEGNKATISVDTIDDHIKQGTMADLPDEVAKQHKVLLYYAALCDHCRKAKELLDNSTISYDYYDWKGEPRGLWVMSAVLQKTGQSSPPVIYMCGQSIGGYEALEQLSKSGQLQSKASC